MPGAGLARAAPPSTTSVPPAPVRTSTASPLPAPAVPVRAASSSIPPLRLGNIHLPGPHPASWGPNGLPPGREDLAPALRASHHSANGHDEPGIEFYSPLAGGSGNVTWNVTLPTDRSPTQNQSDLYSAIWFGMTLVDQLGWMHQCFLELQFYPDQLFTNPGPQYPNWTVNGKWIGAAVAWQIEAATGYEDPCFYQPLYLGNATSGSSYLNMSQGDQLTITMNGWLGSPYGENLTIQDWTQHQDSVLNLWDFAGNYPLDPAYAANNVENGLQWTPGGEYPVAFAFETGHAGNPDYPVNNVYGGCSPGKPPATLAFPSVPCPSYDASSWANDTLSPWQIGIPTFQSGAAVDHPVQVAFTQDFGGVGLLSAIGLGACNGQIGSAWCTYPWYSYSCLTHAFNFGATDYPGMTDDFGQFYEYSQALLTNDLGLGYYPPANYSIPTCGQSSYALSVGTTGVTGGTVYFLSQDVPSATYPSLLPGNYSIFPVAPALGAFDHWVVTGGVSILGSVDDEWATVHVAGIGSVSADFVASPTMTTVTFDDIGTTVPGTIVLSPGRTYTDGVPLGTLTNGASMLLAPGIYGIEALPSPGSNFTSWTASGSSASVQGVDFPTGLLDITSGGGTATVTASDSPSSDGATMFVQVFGAGNASFAGITTNFLEEVNVSVGSYPASALPDPGGSFLGWQYSSSASMTDFTAVTNVTVENGSSYLNAIFAPIPVSTSVTLNTSPSGGGMIALGGTFPLPSGTVVAALPGVSQVLAFPASGDAIGSWSVNNSAAAWINGTGWDPTVLINASVTITATFLPRPTGNVTFIVAPASSGFVDFNGAAYSNGQYNASVGSGTFWLDAYAFPGWQLADRWDRHQPRHWAVWIWVQHQRRCGHDPRDLRPRPHSDLVRGDRPDRGLAHDQPYHDGLPGRDRLAPRRDVPGEPHLPGRDRAVPGMGR
ncbi:MAG: hypothetical protein L3J91_00230 [Thermoplasmata archaeon]|nr:hypothetical protein [Thermoplasmata archaeon]